MPMIYVRAKPGVIARMSPRGPVIPHDKYVPVEDTAYIRRLLDHHGDIEKRGNVKDPDAAPPSKK